MRLAARLTLAPLNNQRRRIGSRVAYFARRACIRQCLSRIREIKSARGSVINISSEISGEALVCAAEARLTGRSGLWPWYAEMARQNPYIASKMTHAVIGILIDGRIACHVTAQKASMTQKRPASRASISWRVNKFFARSRNWLHRNRLRRKSKRKCRSPWRAA